MLARRAARRWWLSASVCYLFLAAVTWDYEVHAAPRLKPSGENAFQPMRGPGRPQAPGSGGGGSGGAKIPYARIHRVPKGYDLSYGFKNFNSDVLAVQAQLDTEVVADSIREYGFRQDDFKALDAWYQQQRQDAIALADTKFVKGQVSAKSREELEAKLKFINDMNASVQKELDDKLEALSQEYGRKRNQVYVKGGYRFENANTIEADIPAMAKRNWKRVRPVTQSFARLAQDKSYEAEDLVGAVVAMVQTSLRYEIPPDKEGSRVITGVTSPPETLVLGEGDCNTKAALIASILLSWPNIKLVGLEIPGHYLMGYHRIPRSGDVFLEYQGLQYVMLESAGPGWIPPGTVGDHTQAYLDSGQDFRIQPFSI